MDIAISSCEQGTFQGSSVDFGYLRLYANGNWVDSDGFQHIGGAVDSNQYYESFACTIDTDGIIHIPSINIQTTTDAVDNPNVRITAAVYVGNNKTHSNILAQNVFIPVELEPSTTWEMIRESNQATQAEIGLPPNWWVLVLGLFNTLTSAAQKASRVIFGVIRTSVDPEDAADPIALGDNDPRARYDQTTISIAGSGTTSPTADAIDYPIVELTGTLTGDRIINWPVTGTRDTIVFWNNTTGIYNVYVKATTETEAFVIVPQGTQSSLLNDGATVIDYSPVAYRPVSMAAFGDSITAGYGVVDGGDWPTLLSNSICSTVANRAVNGSNAADAATRLDNETMFQDQFVIIWVGHNDIAGGTVSSVLASIASMVADIDSENFLILGTLNQRSMVKFSAGWEFITELNDACAVLYPNNFFNMQEYLVSLGSGVDVTLDIIPAIYMQPDGQHPNELGMETIAARLVIYFNKRVQEQRTLNIGAEDFIYTGNRPFLGAPNINDNFTVYLGNYPTDPTVIPTRSVVIAPHFEPSGAAQADFSVVVGSGAGVGLTDANSVYVGAFAGGSATNGGNSSTCVGYFSGNANGGFQNAFFGSQSGLSNTTGSYNTFIGRQAGASNLTGSQGVFIGTDAGNLHTAGNNVILIGYNVQASTTTVANELNIGNVIGGNLDTSVKKFGYAPGTGGTATQGTSRTTTVVINKSNGEITLFSAAGSATATSFTVSNSTVVATDRIILNQKSGTNKYLAFVTAVGTGSFEITFFTTGGTAVDAPVIGFTVLGGVNA